MIKHLIPKIYSDFKEVQNLMFKTEGIKTLNQWDRPYYCKKLKK